MSLVLVNKIVAPYGDAQTTPTLNFSLELKGCMQNVFLFFFSVDKEKKLNSFNNLPVLFSKIQLTHLIGKQVNYWATSLSIAPFNSLNTQGMRNYHTCSQSVIQTSNCTDYTSSNNDPLFTKQRWLIKLSGLKLNIALKIIKKEIKIKKDPLASYGAFFNQLISAWNYSWKLSLFSFLMHVAAWFL